MQSSHENLVIKEFDESSTKREHPFHVPAWYGHLPTLAAFLLVHCAPLLDPRTYHTPPCLRVFPYTYLHARKDICCPCHHIHPFPGQFAITPSGLILISKPKANTQAHIFVYVLFFPHPSTCISLLFGNF